MRSGTACRRAIYGRSQRRGIVLVAVIVAASVCLVLCGIWARVVVREHRRLASQQYQIQSTRLAEAGLRRAIALRAADAKYSGETWAVPKSELDKSHDGQVLIQVAPSDDAQSIRYKAMAEFPSGEMRHAQITKSISLPSLNTADKP